MGDGRWAMAGHVPDTRTGPVIRETFIIFQGQADVTVHPLKSDRIARRFAHRANPFGRKQRNDPFHSGGRKDGRNSANSWAERSEKAAFCT